MALAVVAPMGAVAAASLPGPVLFLYDAQTPGDIPQLARLGLNTLYLDLEFEDCSDLAELDGRIRLAQQHGLKTIIALPTIPRAFGQVPSPFSERYRERMRETLTPIVTHFKANPSVIAWATGGFLERSIGYSVGELRAYLQRVYGDTGSLSRAWGTAVNDWGTVTEQLAQEADAKLPFGVGRALVDVAEYKRQAFHDVMALWAGIIKGLDPGRPLLTGRIALYRSLTAVPNGFDIVCPFMPPDELDPDSLTHNVHAVDMARRGGRFEVLPCLRVPLDQGSYARGELARWIGHAALHGACGIGLDSWVRIRESLAPQVIAQELGKVVAWAAQSIPFNVRPQATIAFLYEPYGGGFEVGDQTAYGYVSALPEGEPNNPFWAFRVGTRYGPVDYFTLEDLPLAQLDRYGVVFAPQALRMPTNVRAQLTQYVYRGGALVCDLGTGLYETGSWIALPEDLGVLFGIRTLTGMQDVARELSVSWTPPWLPSLVWGMKTRGAGTARGRGAASVGGAGGPRVEASAGGRTMGLREGSAAERRPHHVVGPACYALLAPSAGAVATLDSKWVDGSQVIAGLIGNPTGPGVACFATHRLWADWVISDPVYEGFHGDLCARRSRIEVLGEGFWTPEVQATATPTGVAVHNAALAPTYVSVITDDAGHALHTNAFCVFSALARRPDGLRSGAARLSLAVPALGVVTCERLPILVQPYEGTCMVRLMQQAARRLVLEAGGDGAEVQERQKTLVIGEGRPNEVRFTVRDGVYRVLPGSVHRVVVDIAMGKAAEGQVTANSEGELRFSAVVSRARVIVTQEAKETGAAIGPPGGQRARGAR